MITIYDEKNETVFILHKVSHHFPPHIHKTTELIYVTNGTLELGINEDLSLGSLVKSLGVNKFLLSRVFSSTFHKNFNQYLNEHRLNYACSRLEYSNAPITEICLDAGFQSQRTFNRVFQDAYHMTPREYKIGTKNDI